MHVRTANADEIPAVMNVLDGAVLSIAVETVRAGAEDGGTLVAVSGDDETDGRVLGALVLDDTHIEPSLSVGVAAAKALGRRLSKPRSTDATGSPPNSTRTFDRSTRRWGSPSSRWTNPTVSGASTSSGRKCAKRVETVDMPS